MVESSGGEYLLRPTKTTSGPAAPGVIDTLRGGFAQVNRIPWILGFPILLDVMLWLAPRLSAAPVLHRLASALSSLYGSGAATGLDDSTVSFVRDRIAEFDAAASTFNLLFLIPGSLAQIPSIEPASFSG